MRLWKIIPFDTFKIDEISVEQSRAEKIIERKVFKERCVFPDVTGKGEPKRGDEGGDFALGRSAQKVVKGEVGGGGDDTV